MDLLIQARPKFVVIDFDPPFTVTTFPATTPFGVVFSLGGGTPFQSNYTRTKTWARNAYGVDGSPQVTNLVTGNTFDVNGAGSASCRIPLQTPASVGNLQLQLARSYTSIYPTG